MNNPADTNLRLVRFEVLSALMKSSAIRGGAFLDPRDESSKFIRIVISYVLGDATACPPRPRPSTYRATYRSPAICGLLKGAVVFDFSGRWIHSHQLLSQHAPRDSHFCVLFHSCAPLRQGDETCVHYKATIVFYRTELGPSNTRLEHWVSSEIFIPPLLKSTTFLSLYSETCKWRNRKTDIFFPCRKVPFNTGTLILDVGRIVQSV